MKKQFCKHGHDTFVTGRDSTSHCIACKKEWFTGRSDYNKEYYKRTIEYQLARAKEYRDTHIDQIKVYNKEYNEIHNAEIKKRNAENYDPQKAHERYIIDRDKLLVQNKAWAKTIAGKFSRLKAKAKSRKINFDLTLEQYTEVIFRSCHYCSTDLVSITGGCIDRIDNDKSIGYKINNILPCCPSCNAIRNRLHTIEETLVMVHILKAIRKFPFLIEILKKKDLGFIKSPFIDENSWYPNRGQLRKCEIKFTARFNALVGRQKIEKMLVLLSFEEYEKLLSQLCFYCGSSLIDSKGRGLDQIIPNNRYEIGNVLPCCFVCNTIKNNRFTVDETKVMVIVRNLFRKKFLQEN